MKWFQQLVSALNALVLTFSSRVFHQPSWKFITFMADVTKPFVIPVRRWFEDLGRRVKRMHYFIYSNVHFRGVKPFLSVLVSVWAVDVFVRVFPVLAGRPSPCSRRGRTGSMISVCGTPSSSATLATRCQMVLCLGTLLLWSSHRYSSKLTTTAASILANPPPWGFFLMCLCSGREVRSEWDVLPHRV